MEQRELSFKAVAVGDGEDGRWATLARSGWSRAVGWLPDDADQADQADEAVTPRARGAEDAARRLFTEHMPELVPVVDRLAAQLAGLTDGRRAHAVLRQVGLRPFFSACTQTAVDGVLLRNYDLSPDACERTILSSTFLRPVIGMSEALWGLLDGMNDAGLAVSLTFGGRFVHGPGFAVPVLLRYLLETCRTVDEGVAALRRIPIATAQNITLVGAGDAVTVQVGPDIPAAVTGEACAANHQHAPVPPEQERLTRTEERLATIRAAAAAPAPAYDDAARVDAVLQALLRPPLYQSRYDEWLGTLYTAVYRPAEGRVRYHWPEESWEQSFAEFVPGALSPKAGLAA